MKIAYVSIGYIVINILFRIEQPWEMPGELFDAGFFIDLLMLTFSGLPTKLSDCII